ncbi:hypothetical protein RUMOBE_03749 [Blautia obeum ATCC 29174]|uniref:Uncharacterized protein n=1 Tax=Blautia obeum ATCC 29174 TaxID=411459 RepID=A5ZXJ6_9FIRM|nr:hypothetical protein RUMOBE_03749 [Blautia obeum ATCC 29174]
MQKVLFFSVRSIIICKEQFCKEKGDSTDGNRDKKP